MLGHRNTEALAKILHCEPGELRLTTANPNYAPLHLPPRTGPLRRNGPVNVLAALTDSTPLIDGVFQRPRECGLIVARYCFLPSPALDSDGTYEKLPHGLPQSPDGRYNTLFWDRQLWAFGVRVYPTGHLVRMSPRRVRSGRGAMSKIATDHLARDAIVYIRQSTQTQLRHNHESHRRQYGLADRARGLGWNEPVVIDEDLGRSGGGTSRPGFERLLVAICEGRVGIVLSLEASRLARNGRDWHTLLEFCALVGCLLGDEDGVYDPRLPNDRLLLGMKGTMSNATHNISKEYPLGPTPIRPSRGYAYAALPTQSRSVVHFRSTAPVRPLQRPPRYRPRHRRQRDVAVEPTHLKAQEQRASPSLAQPHRVLLTGLPCVKDIARNHGPIDIF